MQRFLILNGDMANANRTVIVVVTFIKIEMRKNVGLAVACGLFLSWAASGREMISPQKELGHTLEQAVMCKADALGFFNGNEFGVSDDTKQRIEALGGSVAGDPEHDGAIKYHFPAGIKVFGYEAREALFFSESTTLFFVTLQSGLKHLPEINRMLRLSPIKRGNPDGYGYFGKIDVRYIRKLNKNHGDFPDTIFSGVEDLGGRDYIVLGCQNLAW